MIDLIKKIKQINYIVLLMIMTCFIFNSYCYGQNDCKVTLKDYQNTIDTTQRPVYILVDSMPDILTSSKILKFFSDKIQVPNSSNCFPIYIYYGFVIEKDCSISNVFICPTLEFCDDYDKLEIEKQKIIEYLTNEVLKIKTNAGMLNGEKVAVKSVGRIHFDPQ